MRLRKNIIVFPFILFLFLTVNGQKVNSGIITGSGDHNNRYLDMFQDFKKKINTPIPLSEMDGSPYLKEEFIKGQIFQADSSLGAYFLRYNIYNDVMEVLTQDDKIMELRKSPSLKVFINNKRFKVLPYLNSEKKIEQAYFEIMEDGKRIDLLKKHSCTYIPGERAKTSFHVEKKPELESSIDYYLFFNNENLPSKIERLNERNIIKQLGIDKKEIMNLVKRNDLNLRDIEDVNKLVTLINSTS
ncbi:hypothetical protein NE848_07845 [Gramella jeungdoensis]|uniref:Uncharacterized protein n=1 Tax=Gramella jeungdoensis TaxID=708091 RepID=A0ABT0Z0M8_9FLAO|nr:hypothetical protein [Gramella jeungdoensis]MCM8569287.1 hypothetical protein [Gramella jeungdoensis]